MPEVTTSADVHHVRGRTYKITCDKHHRPAQIPRRSVPALYYGEVTTENADDFYVMFIRADLERRLQAMAAQGDPDGSDLTFNEILARLVSCLEDPDADKNAWLPIKDDYPANDEGAELVIHNTITSELLA